MLPPAAVVAALVTVTALAAVLAKRVGMPHAILLVLVGVAVSLAPGIPDVQLNPDVMLLLLLPPLLYTSGVGMSWRGFRANLRAILLLAIGCVLFTASAVAAVAHYALGMSWAAGFVLGAVVSPPDAVAPMAIARRLGLPRRILIILEGEGLVNDATALILFSFALTAVATGRFSLVSAVGRFGVITLSELAYGIAVGWAALRLRRWSKDPEVEIALSLVTPFAAFWPPHAYGSSGVIACVAAGLWVSWNGPRFIQPATRLQGFFIWGLATWLVEGVVFLLVGLQARHVAAGLADARWVALAEAGAFTCLTVIVVRFVWVYPATYLPRLIPSVGAKDPPPPWTYPALIGFTGIRGAVSVAAALSIPLTAAGRPFPGRDLILFATFCVIIVTLIGQGGLLPWLIRALGLDRAGHAEAVADKRREREARLAGIDAVLSRLDAVARDGAPEHAVAAARRLHEDRRKQLAVTADESNDIDAVGEETQVQLQLIAAERDSIADAYANARITDEARRRIEREFDLEEARAAHAAASAADDSGGGDPADGEDEEQAFVASSAATPPVAEYDRVAAAKT